MRANVNAMEENVTFNIHLSTVESEDNILVNAMSYTMYKIGTFLIYLVILGPVRFFVRFFGHLFLNLKRHCVHSLRVAEKHMVPMHTVRKIQNNLKVQYWLLLLINGYP